MAAKAKKTITGLQEAYLDYVNNYISVLKFAADYGMTEAMAKATTTATSRIGSVTGRGVRVRIA